MSKNDKLFERISKFSINDKQNALQKHVLYMLDKFESLIDIKGLPLTIPKRVVVRQLLENGFTIIAKENDNLYAFYGGLGGQPDVNYDPTIAVVANPALKLSKQYNIDEDCILIRNDSSMLGIVPILEKFGCLDAELMITMRLMAINNRITALINADDDAGYASACKFLKDIEDGKLGVIQSSGFFNGVQTNDFSNRAGDIKDVIELKTFLDSKEWEEFGMNINGNAKREYVNDTEMNISQPAVLPLISNMLEQWREGFYKVNAMFGTEIEVDFTPLIQYVEERSNENEEPESNSETEGTLQPDTVAEPDREDSDEDVKIYEVGEDKEDNEEVTEDNGEVTEEPEDATEFIAEEMKEVTEEEIVEAEKAKKGEDSDYTVEDAPKDDEAEDEVTEEGDDEDEEKSED